MSTLPDSTTTIRDCRVLFLQRLGALIEASGALSAPAIQAIQRGAGGYFDKIVASSRRGSFREEAHGLTSSSITLVGEDELEMGIRLDNLSARLFEATGGDLWKIHLRFVTLLKRPDLAKANNPVGPNGIARGLEEIFSAAGAITLDKKLDMLDRLEAWLLKDLPALYAEINEFLADRGAEAAAPSIVTSADLVGKASAGRPVDTDHNLLALEQALLADLPKIVQSRSRAESSEGAVSSLLTKATLERLTFRLNELDRHGSYAPAFQPGASSSLETLIPGLFSDEAAASPAKPKSLNAAELGVPAMTPEGLDIDTLAMIFATIFDHPKLPDALKAVISSLQITMLKLALQDAGFFKDPLHPARLLLDKMGLAMLGLPVDVPVRHPLCQQLFEIAGQLRSKFSGNVAVFNEALAQVDALIVERHAGIARAAEPYLPLLDQLDRPDQASLASRRVLDKLFERGVPVPIGEFLNDTWSKVLQLVWLEHGPSSSQWQAHNSVIEELLWTFQPKSAAEDRQGLARRLPEILKLLKAGMERVGIPAEAQAAFLDTSFALQTQALRKAPTAAAEPDPEENKRLVVRARQRAAGEPVAGAVQSGNLRLRTLGFVGCQPAPAEPLPCQPGDWLEIQLADGETHVLHLCLLGQPSLRALLYNPDPGLAFAIHLSILDKQFRQGLARVCSADSLFDVAADRSLRRKANG